ncbi:HD domain-containing protein [Desulfuromonas carbonis]|uniref:HD-GYP domain-containing protein n=1 Tax=Desulfuromonas sp. DDH964 TaxID=1823759 RepID=UPI00078D1139|nr:HD-GYP domain-containing protein [Desulfuromonas sp. DDH964]AMV73263.1 cyclic diguanylate phosphodiesterase [Desulfuromonas sp. DDH964]
MTLQGNSQSLDRDLVRLGKSLSVQFFVLLKTAQNYPEGHAALATPVSQLQETVRQIHRHNEEPSIRTQGSYLLLGDVRLKPDAAGAEAIFYVLTLMKRLGIGGIQFDPAVATQQLSRFATLLNEIEPGEAEEDIYYRVVTQLHGRGITGIELEPLAEESETAPPAARPGLEDGRARSQQIYLQTVSATAEVMENAKMGQTLRLRKSKRVVQTMIDQLLDNETNLLGLTTIRCHDEYTYNHSVNVCILSLAIGQRIGLSRGRLCELGMAALFHDIGKSDIPTELLNKPQEFEPEEWRIIQKHPVLGVKLLMKLKGLDLLNARIIVGSFEHHLNFDLSGYPKYPYRRLSLFGRIISIADCYDAMTSSRVYTRTPIAPEKALRLMLDKAGKTYDPVLLKVFVNCIGTYPLGTLLRLNTGELAVVVGNPEELFLWDRPLVQIIADPAGNEIDGATVDLSADGSRNIAKTLDARQFGIDTSRYFL